MTHITLLIRSSDFESHTQQQEISTLYCFQRTKINKDGKKKKSNALLSIFIKQNTFRTFLLIRNSKNKKLIS